MFNNLTFLIVSFYCKNNKNKKYIKFKINKLIE